jgi:hypothetical protein
MFTCELTKWGENGFSTLLISIEAQGNDQVTLTGNCCERDLQIHFNFGNGWV